MGPRSVLQAFLVVTCGGLGGTALAIRSRIRDVQPLPSQETDALMGASSLTDFSPTDRVAHRRVYAYRLEGLMSSKHAIQEVLGGGASHHRDVASAPSPVTPSLGSLYALHAIESAFPFRSAWLWHTFWDTYRISNTFNVWWRTRPVWMSSMRAMLAEAADEHAKEAVIREAAEEVEKLSGERYEGLLEAGAAHGAVIRGGPRMAAVADNVGKEGSIADLAATEPPSAASMYGVRFDLPDPPSPEEQQHPHPRSAPLYVLYVSAPYRSEHPTELWERVRAWKDDWYSRWFAAHVAKSLSRM